MEYRKLLVREAYRLQGQSNDEEGALMSSREELGSSCAVQFNNTSEQTLGDRGLHVSLTIKCGQATPNHTTGLFHARGNTRMRSHTCATLAAVGRGPQI